MKPRALPRFLLSALLIWQLGASALVHASMLAAGSTAPMHSHCSHHSPATTEQGQRGAESPPHGTQHPAAGSHTMCCAHSSCISGCAVATTVTTAFHFVLAAAPSQASGIAFVPPLIPARPFEFLRPPI